MYVAWALIALFLRSSGHFNTDPACRTGVLVRRLRSTCLQALAGHRVDRWIVEENVDPKTAQGLLRHTDAGLTMNIYTHAQDPAKRAALEKFESRLVR